MKQYQAVEKISQAIINDQMAEAIFLKGSLARKEEDEFSDVDFYVIVEESHLQQFLQKRLEYLKSYGPIMHFFETNFVGPQIVCIFEDGLHFDLYVTTLDRINHFDQIAIIYDPKHLLDKYQKMPLALSNNEIANIIHSFCFTVIEFQAAHERKDFIFAFRLAHHMLADLGCYVRTIVDPEHAKIGLKRFHKMLKEPYLTKYLEIVQSLRFDNYLLSVKLMMTYFDNLINNVPLRIAEFINFDFFQYSKKIIMGME
ncbi:MAG: aminoglycoside 6-adenylyltransferase [Bacilli bacterium]